MEEPNAERMDYVRGKLAAAYEKGTSPASTLDRDPREVEAPQRYFSELLEEVNIQERLGGTMFLRYEDSLDLMRNKAIVQPGNGLLMGSPRPLLPLDLDGELHTKYRKLLDPLFAPRQINPLEERIRRMANELIDDFIEIGQVELYKGLCDPLPSRIFVAMMGLPESDRERFIAWKDRTIKPEEGDPVEMLAGIQAAGAEMAEYIGGVLDERSAASEVGDDLLSQLLHAEVEGERLTKQQVSDIVYLLMIAGLDTVTSALSLIFARLADVPELRQSLVDRPELIPNAVEELMRYEAPVASSSRLVTEDIEVGEVQLSEGSYVLASWQACNLDPEIFECPLDVDFERPNIRHTSFATGPHRCMGSHLARVEMRWALEEFHKRIPSYWITEGETPEFTYGGVRAATYLPISFSAVGQAG